MLAQNKLRAAGVQSPGAEEIKQQARAISDEEALAELAAKAIIQGMENEKGREPALCLLCADQGAAFLRLFVSAGRFAFFQRFLFCFDACQNCILVKGECGFFGFTATANQSCQKEQNRQRKRGDASCNFLCFHFVILSPSGEKLPSCFWDMHRLF